MKLDKEPEQKMDQLRQQAIRNALQPVKEAPRLWRFFGCGTTMMGRYYDTEAEPTFYSLLWFTIFMIPISPMGIYLVSQPRSSYFFHAEITRRDFNTLYRNGYLRLVWNSLLETIIVFGAVLLIFGILLFFRKLRS